MINDTVYPFVGQKLRHKLQVARQAAQVIAENAQDLQIYVLNQTDNLATQRMAMDSLRAMGQAAGKIMALSDERLAGAVVDPGLLLEQLRAVRDGRTAGVREVELARILELTSDLGSMLYESMIKARNGQDLGREAS